MVRRRTAPRESQARARTKKLTVLSCHEDTIALIMRTLTVAIMLFCTLAFAQPPAGDRPAHRAATGESILPGGRIITPLGEQFFTGPGPFGIAVNPSGKIVATADGGPNRYALTILDAKGVRHLAAHRKRDNDDKGADKDDDDADWQSVFMGLAFEDESKLYASEGETGKVRLIDVATGKRLARFDLNHDGYKDSYTGDLALDSNTYWLKEEKT